MTNDELERVMNFIVERQEHVAEQQSISADQLAQAEAIITALATKQGEHDQRIARFERSYTAISDLLAKHDNQLVVVTDNVNRLTDTVAALSATVERYIAARNNDSGSA